MFNDQTNKLIIVILVVIALIQVNIGLYYVFVSIYRFVSAYNIVSWIIFISVIEFLTVYLTWRSRKIRIIVTTTMLATSFVVVFFFSFIEDFNYLQVFLLVVFYTSFFMFTKRKRSLNTRRGFIYGILCVGTLAFLYFLSYASNFFLMKLIYFGVSLITLLTTRHVWVREVKVKKPKSERRLTLIKLIPLVLIITSGIVMIAPVRELRLQPNNNPKIIFWSAHNSLPDDEEILTKCGNNDIGFAVVVRARNMDSTDFTTELKTNLERLNNYSVEFGLALLGNVKSFMTTFNVRKFTDYIDTVIDWFKANDLWDDVKFVVVDAETDPSLVKDLAGESTTDKTGKLFTYSKTKEETREDKKALQEFVDKIRDDGKRAGIVKMPAIQDQYDGDRDFSGMMMNVYQLDAGWDFSVSMIYRTQHFPGLFDLMIVDYYEKDYTSRYSVPYLEQDELERNLLTTEETYFKIGMEIYSDSEVGVKRDNRYVFIGTFRSKFKDTSYIQDKVYIDDLDICRHFNVDEVWLYFWSDFYSRYRMDGFNELIEEKGDNEVNKILLSTYNINRMLIGAMMYAVFDRFIFIT